MDILFRIAVASTPRSPSTEATKGKKKMYLEACLQQHRNLSPFITSVDGLLGVEATAILKSIASRLESKWKQPYSKTCGYVKRDCHHFGAGHPPVYTKITGTCTQNQCAETAMGR